MDTDPDNTGREQGGRFAPGVSGNPAGKPSGSRHRASLLAEKLMADDAEAVVKAVVAAAKEGDIAAARLILDRIAPPCRDAPVSLDLPPLESAADLPSILSFLLASAAGGRVTPGEAEKLARLTGEYGKVVELAQFEERLRRMEEAAANRGSTGGSPTNPA